jgi:hypothetical protein
MALTVKEFIDTLKENPQFSGEFIGEVRGTLEKGVYRIYDTEGEGFYIELEAEPDSLPPGLYLVKVERGQAVSIERVRDVRLVRESSFSEKKGLNGKNEDKGKKRPEVQRKEQQDTNVQKYKDTDAFFAEIEEKLKRVKEEIAASIRRKKDEKSENTGKDDTGFNSAVEAHRAFLDTKEKRQEDLSLYHKRIYQKVDITGKALGEVLLNLDKNHREVLGVLRELKRDLEDLKVSHVRIEGELLDLKEEVKSLKGSLGSEFRTWARRFEKGVMSSYGSGRNKEVCRKVLFLVATTALLELVSLLVLILIGARSV